MGEKDEFELPYYKCFPHEFFSSEILLRLRTAEQLGAFFMLTNYAWVNKPKCFLKDDKSLLMDMSRLSQEQWEKHHESILSFFPVAEEGLRHCPWLQEKLDRLKKVSEAKSLAGKAKGLPNRSQQLTAAPQRGESAKTLKDVQLVPNILPNAGCVDNQKDDEINGSPEPEKKNARSSVSEFEKSFSEFWTIWPKKKNREGALKIWMKLKPSPDLFETIKTAVKNQSASKDWTKDGGQFIPHPTTWLNGCRWEDQIDPEVEDEKTKDLPAFVKNFDASIYSGKAINVDDIEY